MKLEIIDLAYFDVCRSDACDRGDLHSPDECGSAKRRSVVRVDASQLLRDVVYGAIGLRMPKTFSMIYQDVLDDYGSVTQRSVYRVISAMRADRTVALIAPPGSRRVIQAEGIKGGYVRYDSPLLWSRDGLTYLQNQVEDLVRFGHEGN